MSAHQRTNVLNVDFESGARNLLQLIKGAMLALPLKAFVLP